MKYKIEISNPGNHFVNPLLHLAGSECETREEACEAIYDALYAVIDGEDGCEMVDKGDINSRGANYYVACIRNYYANQTNLMGVTVIDENMPLTYSDAVRAKSNLDSKLYYTQSGEAGRPSYYIITQSVVDWLNCVDDSKYDWDKYDGQRDDNGEVDTSSDDYYRFICAEGESYVRNHAIDTEADAQDADDAANLRWHDWYTNKCRAFILREGYAREDGVTATVEEC